MRTENDDIALYRPQKTPGATGNGPSSLQFLKESNYSLPEIPSSLDTEKPSIEQRFRPLRVLPNVSGFSTVFMPGASAAFVLKTSTTVPHVIRLRGDYVRDLSNFDSSEIGCTGGFVYVDSKVFISSKPSKLHELSYFPGYCSGMPVTSRHEIRLFVDVAKSSRGGER